MDFDRQFYLLAALARENVQHVLLEDDATEIAISDDTENVNAMRRAVASTNVAPEVRIVLVDAGEWRDVSALREPRGVRKFRSFEDRRVDRARWERDRAERIRAASKAR